MQNLSLPKMVHTEAIKKRLKNVIDDALLQCRFVKRVIVLTHNRMPVSMIKGRDTWWENEIKKVETQGNPYCEAAEMDAEDPLFILYSTSEVQANLKVVHIHAVLWRFTRTIHLERVSISTA